MAEITLHNYDASKPTELTLRTSGAPINASISLFGPSPLKHDELSTLPINASRGAGSFSVSAFTSDAHLELYFPYQPEDSSLHLHAETSNAATSVVLHPAYEGKFRAASTALQPVLEQHDLRDPAGRGRERKVHVTKLDELEVEGWVWWAEKDDETPRGNGRVEAKSNVMPRVFRALLKM